MALNFGLLDTSIPERLGAMPANALAMRRQRLLQDEQIAGQREQQQMQNALSRMQMSKAQGEMEREEAFRKSFAGVTDGNYEAALPQMYQADPARAMAFQKQLGEQKKAGLDAAKADIDLTLERFKVIDRAAGQFAANPTRQSAEAAMQMLAANGTPPEVIAQMKQRLDAAPDEKLPEMARQFLASTQEGIKAQTARLFPSIGEFEKTAQMAELSPEQKVAAARQKLVKETTHAPGSVSQFIMPLEREEQKAKGKSNVELYGDIRNSASVARKLDAQLESQSRVLGKGFDTGFATETKAAAASVLGALGVKDADKYATDAQTFNAAAKEVVLQKQLAQKGPQTESDAKRIEQTGSQLGNTKAANMFVIDVARAQNAKDIGQQKFFDDYWRKKGTYEGAENAWYSGDGGKSIFEDPRLKKYEAPSAGAGNGSAQRAPSVGTVQGGYRFRGGNPADKNSWEKVQ